MNSGPALASTSAAVGPFLVTKLRALDGRLASIVPRVLLPKDDDAVHDLRVVIRRIRTVLEVGREVLGRYQADEVRRALRDVQRATGALRDEEVLLELLASLGVDRPDVQAWVESRKRRELRLRRALRRMVRAGEMDRARRLLDAMLAFRIKASRDKRLPKFARRVVEDTRRVVERRRDAPLVDPLALHRLRIAYKRLRYTIEVFADALPDDLSSLAHPAARFQSRLGNLHDVDVAVECVHQARTLSDSAREALLAALVRVRADQVTAYQRELGANTIAPAIVVHAVGTDSLRKTSTR
jgi:CHAD domain-containing protein